MKWVELWEKLSDSDKEHFRKTVNVLLTQTYLLEEKFNHRSKQTEQNRDFRYLLRYHELIHGYLFMAGWELEIDELNGYACVSNSMAMGRQDINKFTYYLMLALRMIYDEEHQNLQLRKYVVVTLGDIMEKITLFNFSGKRVADKDLKEAVAVLRKYQMIDRFDGGDTEAETKIIIYPSITHLITGSKIEEVQRRVAALETQSTDTEGEDTKRETVEENSSNQLA